jgi:hypothetical protein
LDPLDERLMQGLAGCHGWNRSRDATCRRFRHRLGRKGGEMREIVAQLGRTVRFALTSNPRTARLCAILVVAVLVYDLVTRR